MYPYAALKLLDNWALENAHNSYQVSQLKNIFVVKLYVNKEKVYGLVGHDLYILVIDLLNQVPECYLSPKQEVKPNMYKRPTVKEREALQKEIHILRAGKESWKKQFYDLQIKYDDLQQCIDKDIKEARELRRQLESCKSELKETKQGRSFCLITMDLLIKEKAKLSNKLTRERLIINKLIGHSDLSEDTKEGKPNA